MKLNKIICVNFHCNLQKVKQLSIPWWIFQFYINIISWSLLGPGVEVGLTPNFMKGIHICPLSIVGSFFSLEYIFLIPANVFASWASI